MGVVAKNQIDYMLKRPAEIRQRAETEQTWFDDDMYYNHNGGRYIYDDCELRQEMRYELEIEIKFLESDLGKVRFKDFDDVRKAWLVKMRFALESND